MRRFFELDLLDNRYPSLHGMRVIGILTVVQLHVTSILAFEEKLPLNSVWTTTSMSIFFGMDLFFFLSGFLIGSILLRSVEVSGSQHVRRFYLRRVFRTFPSYYVVLTGLALTTAMTASQRHHLPFEYFYLTNYVKLTREDVLMLWGWSLGLEEQFYLTVPLLFFLLHKIRSDRVRLLLLGSFWISALVVRLVIYLRGHDWTPVTLYNTVYFKTHTRFDTLIAGIILAYVQRKWHVAIARWLEAPIARALLALASLSCLWILLQPWIFGERWLLLVRVFAWGTITSLMYFAFVLLVLNGGAGWTQRALSAPFFRRAATLGYGVYLVHIPVCDHVVTPVARWLAKTHDWPMPVVWPLSVALLFTASLCVAYFLHILVEKPSLRMRDRLAR
ncbi:MAG TPA: acyltransferase [Polyangiaceae bacterium]|nr:acyltransferase [Polyangiaceae bacterium]